MSISTHIPVGGDPLKHKAGLLTYLFYRAFPIFISGKECDKISCRREIYSNWYCPGFAPDSLFTFRDARSVKAP